MSTSDSDMARVWHDTGGRPSQTRQSVNVVINVSDDVCPDCGRQHDAPTCACIYNKKAYRARATGRNTKKAAKGKQERSEFQVLHIQVNPAHDIR